MPNRYIDVYELKDSRQEARTLVHQGRKRM